MVVLVLVLVEVADFPTSSKIQHRAQFYEELPKASLSKLAGDSPGSTLFLNPVRCTGFPGENAKFWAVALP